MTARAVTLRHETDQFEAQTDELKTELFNHFRKTSYSVLLVEDDDDDAAYVGLSVNKISGVVFEIFRAKRLSEAKEFLMNELPDVILLDLGLPDGRGPVCVEELVQFCAPIVVHSGVGEFADFKLAVEAGALGAMAKGEYSGMTLPLTLLAAIKAHERVVT
jgi:DNA-binding response OmpR family regulator